MLGNSRSSESDSDDDSSDTSSVLTQIGNDEFPGHFVEHEGRLFHSHGDLPYPLPVDGEEQARLNSQHKILRTLLGSHADGPVATVLASEQGRQKRVLDLCSGTGAWVMDMAGIYTDVRFSGVDIVPIGPRTIPRNVHFEVADVTQPLRWPDETMDFVHARNISLAVSNFPQMLREAARVLRRGGLFVSGEIRRQVNFAPGYPGNPDVDAPRAERFYRIINGVLAHRGLQDYTRNIPTYVRESRLFSDGRVRDHVIPIGDWQVSRGRRRRMGLAYLEAISKLARSFGPMLRNEGYTDGFVQELITGFVEDMRTVPGMVGVYQTVWMIKA
ncbi:S-adenosyl-L-methionine-dependent methyltransferase [Scleroderma citrinum]